MIKIKKIIIAIFFAFYFSISEVEGNNIQKLQIPIIYQLDYVPIYFPKQRTIRNFQHERVDNNRQ